MFSLPLGALLACGPDAGPTMPQDASAAVPAPGRGLSSSELADGSVERDAGIGGGGLWSGDEAE